MLRKWKKAEYKTIGRMEPILFKKFMHIHTHALRKIIRY